MNKLAARRWWFRVHKWIGLVLAVLIVPISLSGAALVWDDGLDRLLHPARHATSGTALLPLRDYLAAARAQATDGKRIANIVLPAGDGPVAVTLAPPPTDHGDARPSRTMVYLDPPTARVLDVADTGTGVLRVLHRLHGSLMLPGVGRQVVGWIGIAMMLSCVTGVWLWWPMTGRWASGLRWGRHRETDANLHHLAGFWIALPLFVLSLTGAWICFPGVFGALVGDVPRPGGGAILADRPLDRPALAIDDVVARGSPLAPDAALRTILLPTEHQSDWTLAYDVQPMITVAVADDSGVAARSAQFDGGGRSVAQWMRRVHDGTGMGWLWRTVIFLGGVLPALLAVTGAMMWWRTRRWRAALATKREAGGPAGA